jgi:light-regulated signal transduction histidine kinase (bacteriophytochrome)
MADPARQVRFTIAEGVKATGDANLLSVVMENLIGNAWKYTAKRESALIEFGLDETNASPAYFVRDNGPGFDMAHADRLFRPFQRLPETTEFATGHGIGLATVQRIVERHGGSTWACGEPGKGATFYFTL